MALRKLFSALLSVCLLAGLAAGLACGTRTATRVPTGTPPAGLDVKRLRELLANFGDAHLKPQQVEIKSISNGVGSDNAIVEARIETAFRLARTNGDWQIAEVRLGDRQWESLELVEIAIRREKERRTAGLLKRLGEALTAYQREKGQLVATEDYAVLLDFLAPRYLGDPLRFDWWGSSFIYHGTAASYELRSAGADRKAGTKDDLVLENGVLRPLAD